MFLGDKHRFHALLQSINNPDEWICAFLLWVCSTLTEPVDFEKCIVAIKENAFVASQYPVCITLEDHLSSELQAQAASVRVFPYSVLLCQL